MDRSFDGVMDEALRDGPNLLAIACADVRAGFVLGASAKGDAEREEATNAAASAAKICAPSTSGSGLGSAFEESDAPPSSGALIVPSRRIHAYAQVTRHPELVVVGIGREDTDIAALLDWVQKVASGLRLDKAEA